MRVGTSLIRDVVARFEEIDDRFELIKSIDAEIIKKDFDLDEVITRILNGSMMSLGAKAASAFVVVEGRIIPYLQNCPQPTHFSDTSLSLECISNCSKVEISPSFNPDEVLLLLPLCCDKVPSLKIVLVYVGTWYGGTSSRFDDPATFDFALMLAAQCNILLARRIEADMEHARRSIVDAFFTTQFAPQVDSGADPRWFALVKGFHEFLPSWGPLKIDPPPEVQILTYDGDAETIKLRAGTTDPGPRTPKSLYISTTVCGLIIEHEIKNSRLDHLYINPNREHTGRFATYLQRSDRQARDERPESELVLPVRMAWHGPERTVWLVNLEHPAENVFLKCHIEMIRQATNEVTHLVMSLVREEEEQRSRDRGHFYMLQKILNKMAKTYRHKVGQQTTAAKLSLDALEDVGRRLSGDEKRFFDRLKNSVSAFADLTKTFVSGLPNYVAFGPTSLVPAIMEAVSEFDPTEIEKAEDIMIRIRFEDGNGKEIHAANQHFDVFGSSLIREHIYNLINNSLYAVRRRLKSGEIEKGKIEISVREKPQTDLMNKQDSFSFIDVRIDDNGGGLPKDAERYYSKDHFSTKGEGGTGFGAMEAREYMDAIGGKFRHINRPQTGLDGLSVTLSFPKYDQKIHEHLSRKMNLGSQRTMEIKNDG